MSTIAEQLAALAQIKEDIRQAIIDKGVAVSASTPFADYATLIGDISGGGGGIDPIYHWDFTGEDPLIDKVGGRAALATDISFDSNGATTSLASSRINFQIPLRYYTKVEVEIGTMYDNGMSTNNAAVLGYASSTGSSHQGLRCQRSSNNRWAMWTGSWEYLDNIYGDTYFQNSKVTMIVDPAGKVSFYKDGTLIGSSTAKLDFGATQYLLTIGSNNTSFYTMVIKSLKYYELEH